MLEVCILVRYGMTIDLERCFGCESCTIACKSEHGTPPIIFWRRVIEKEVGEYPNVMRVYLPIQCFHCKDPPCQAVCPVEAITKRDDGIVIVDYDKCVGCRCCAIACPYDACYFLDKIRSYYPEEFIPFEKVKYKQFREGTVTKCDFCVDRIEKGLEPACVQTCPADALRFGDLDDPESEVSRLIRERGGYQLRPELDTDPSVYYLPNMKLALAKTQLNRNEPKGNDMPRVEPSNMVEKIKKSSGQDILLCNQCGECSSACPMTPDMDLPPSTLIRFVQLGKVGDAFRSNTIWRCAMCFTCTSICPRGLDPAAIIGTLKEIALEEKTRVRGQIVIKEGKAEYDSSMEKMPVEELKGLSQAALIGRLNELSRCG